MTFLRHLLPVAALFPPASCPAPAGVSEQRSGLPLTSAPGVCCSSHVLHSSASRSRPEASPALTAASDSGCRGHRGVGENKKVSNGGGGRRPALQTFSFWYRWVRSGLTDASTFGISEADTGHGFHNRVRSCGLSNHKSSRRRTSPHSHASWS